MKVSLKNPKNGHVKHIKWGVSFLVLFFGGWYYLFKGMFMFLLFEIILDCFTFTGIGVVIPMGYHLIMFLCGNKLYAKHLYKNGWQPADERSADLLSR